MRQQNTVERAAVATRRAQEGYGLDTVNTEAKSTLELTFSSSYSWFAVWLQVNLPTLCARKVSL